MAQTVLDPETRFLVDLCARSRGWHPVPAAPAQGEFSWDRFVDQARKHKVLGVAYRALKAGLAPAPAPVLAALKAALTAKVMTQTLLLSDWQKVEAAFQEAGIRVLMFKGPALAVQLFGDPMAREYKDIDLLVDDANLDRLDGLFQSLGYEPTAKPELDEAGRDFDRSHARHREYQKPGFPLQFEVHGTKGNTIGLTALETEKAFGRSVVLESGGIRFPTLAQEDHALLCLFHGTHHAWCLLQWVLDQWALANWEALAAAPDLPGFPAPRRTLNSFARFCQNLVQAPPLEGRGRDRVSRWTSDYALGKFAGPGGRQDTAGELLGEKRYWAQLHSRWSDKVAVQGRILDPNLQDLATFRGLPGSVTLARLARPVLAVGRWLGRSRS